MILNAVFVLEDLVEFLLIKQKHLPLLCRDKNISTINLSIKKH